MPSESLSNQDRLNRPISVDLSATVYEELRGIAGRKLRGNRSPLLQPTMLVHEALVRVAAQVSHCKNREHLRALACEMMYRVLIDHVRRELSIKGGGLERFVPLDAASGSGKQSDVVESLIAEEALRILESEHPEAASVLAFRVFEEASFEQCAARFGISKQTARERWEFARAWVLRRLDGRPRGDGGERPPQSERCNK